VESAEIKLTYQRNFLLHNLTVNYELKVITRLVLLSGEYVPLYSLTFTLSILDMHKLHKSREEFQTNKGFTYALNE